MKGGGWYAGIKAYTFLLFLAKLRFDLFSFVRKHPSLNTVTIEAGDPYTLICNLLLICLLLAAKKNVTLIQPQTSLRKSNAAFKALRFYY